MSRPRLPWLWPRPTALAVLLGILLTGLAACNYPSPTASAPALPTVTAAPPSPTFAPQPLPSPSPTPGPEDCGQDITCLAQAAQSCTPASGDVVTDLDFGGAMMHTVTHFIIQGPNEAGQCVFQVSTTEARLTYSEQLRQQMKAGGMTDEQIEAQRQQAEQAQRESGPAGDCLGQGSDLAALLQRWHEGTYSLDDWAPFTCTGPLAAQAGQSEIQVTVVVTVEYADEATPSPALSPTPAYPTPSVLYLRQEQGQNGQVIFYLQVHNWAHFPDELFERSERYPRCANFANPSRTWVRILDADTGQILRTICSFSTRYNLREFWFIWAPATASRPHHIQVDFWDRLEDQHYTSAPVFLP